MAVSLSDSQWKACVGIKDWFFNSPAQQCFRLFGGAGTGKTEIAKTAIEELGLDLADVVATTPTGKSANVLARRGFPDACTIHSAMYVPVPQGKGKIPELQDQLARMKANGLELRLVERMEKLIRDEIRGVNKMGWSLKTESIISKCKLILLDECSMIGARMGEDLLSFDKKILILGDPNQLPPVMDGDFFTGQAADALLTEIHRQHKDSAIIKLAYQMLDTGILTPGVYEDPSGFHSIVTSKSDPDKLLGASQILVGRNATRHATNRWVRERLGRTSQYPVIGDRVVCLKNNKDLGIMNGMFGTIVEDSEDVNDKVCTIFVELDDFPEREPLACLARKSCFYGDPKEVPHWEWEDCTAWDYSNAATVHKFQGSQAPHVAINMEWPNGDTWKRWGYTGLTRAQISDYVVI